MITTESLLKLGEPKRRSFLNTCFQDGRLLRRPDVVIPEGAPVLLMEMNDAAQRDARYSGIQLALPQLEGVVLINGQELIAAAFVHLLAIEAVFRQDGALLGYIPHWNATIAPRTGSVNGDPLTGGTLARYRRARRDGGESPYALLKHAAVTLTQSRPLWACAYMGAYAGLGTDGSEMTEVVWSGTDGLAAARKTAAVWNKFHGHGEFGRRVRNWLGKIDPADPDLRRLPRHIDLPREVTIASMLDPWYGESGPEVYRLATATVQSAASSLLHAHTREEPITKALVRRGISPNKIVLTLVERGGNPIERARGLCGLVTILARPEDYSVVIEDKP